MWCSFSVYFHGLDLLSFVYELHAVSWVCPKFIQFLQEPNAIYQIHMIARGISRSDYKAYMSASHE